jgi:hypothetical protein
LEKFEECIWKVLRRNHQARKGVVKLSDGFSGEGNVIMDVTPVQQRLCLVAEEYESSDETLRAVTHLAFETMSFHCHTWQDYYEESRMMGAIFEIFIDFLGGSSHDCTARRCQQVVSSPSVQVVIVNEDGSVSVLSTHEQILDDQVYHGCEFPCRPDYREQLMKYGRKIGKYLSGHGVKGRFGVDFFVLVKDGWWVGRLRG